MATSGVNVSNRNLFTVAAVRKLPPSWFRNHRDQCGPPANQSPALTGPPLLHPGLRRLLRLLPPKVSDRTTEDERDQSGIRTQGVADTASEGGVHEEDHAATIEDGQRGRYVASSVYLFC